MNSIGATSILTELVDTLQNARHVVIFTDAGVSAESGIPTFSNSLSGLWANFGAERLTTPDLFRKNKALVWGWYAP